MLGQLVAAGPDGVPLLPQICLILACPDLVDLRPRLLGDGWDAKEEGGADGLAGLRELLAADGRIRVAGQGTVAGAGFGEHLCGELGGLASRDRLRVLESLDAGQRVAKAVSACEGVALATELGERLLGLLAGRCPCRGVPLLALDLLDRARRALGPGRAGEAGLDVAEVGERALDVLRVGLAVGLGGIERCPGRLAGLG